MNEMSNFAHLHNSLNNYDFKLERELLKEIEYLNLASDNSICYIKNLFSKTEKILFYIFNESKIYRVKFNDEDDETIEFELFNKCDVKSIKFTVDFERDYTLSFSIGDCIEWFESTKDVNNHHKGNYNEIIQSIIKYFNE